MIYRKTPPQPPRMLLRLVTAAGASAVVIGAGACGSTAGPGASGLIDSGSDEVTCANGCGLVDGSGGGFYQEAGGGGDAFPPTDAHDEQPSCGVCGVVDGGSESGIEGGGEGGEAGGDAAGD